jgi:hypothetical protein
MSDLYSLNVEKLKYVNRLRNEIEEDIVKMLNDNVSMYDTCKATEKQCRIFKPSEHYDNICKLLNEKMVIYRQAEELQNHYNDIFNGYYFIYKRTITLNAL